MTSGPRMSVIVPCFNDADRLAVCLSTLFAQTLVASDVPFEIVVVLNGCTDHSAGVVGRWQRAAEAAANPTLRLVQLARPSKSAALNAGDAAASATIRAYLDADVTCAPTLLEELLAALDTEEPRYATGTIALMPARSRISAAYGDFWLCLVQRDVIGIGLYAVNASGRARWGAFPALHSDDKFVRLNFAAGERVRVAAAYHWPLPEGWLRLLSVRLRWTEGNLELRRRYPVLSMPQSRARRPFVFVPLALSRPLSFLAFLSVYIVCRLLARADVDTEGMRWRRAR
jgi:glycosyltransferase involved in cell wall biosynthesis